MSVATVTGGKVFGKLSLIGVSNRLLVDLYEDNILQPSNLSFVDRSGREITLDVHNYTLEKIEGEFNPETRIVKVDYVVSINVSEEDNEAALLEAHMIFNELIVDIFTFNLKTYVGHVYFFNVLDYNIKWSEFLSDEEC